MEEIKEWSLERLNSSYDSIIDNIMQNWFVDSWYMNFANLKSFKVLEKKLLDFAMTNRKSQFWDLLTKSFYLMANFYGQLSKREFNAFIFTL